MTRFPNIQLKVEHVWSEEGKMDPFSSALYSFNVFDGVSYSRYYPLDTKHCLTLKQTPAI